MVAISRLLANLRCAHNRAHMVAFNMNQTALTLIRVAATAIITGLSAAFAYYPNQLWMPAVIAASSAIGIHVIPSVGEVTRQPNPTVKRPTAPFTGE